MYQAPQPVKLIAYKTLCRPLLEYASEAWDPPHQYLTNDLEAVQSKAQRFIFNLGGWDVSITSTRLLNGIESLQKRRQLKRFSMFNKVCSSPDLFPTITDTLKQMQNSNLNVNTRSNSHNSLACNTNIHLQNFTLRTAREMRTGEVMAD